MTQICYWQARSLQDTIAIFFNLFFILVIALFMHRIYMKANYKVRNVLKNPYKGIIFWMLISIVKNMFSLIVYYTQIQNQKKEQLSDTFIRIFMILDTIPAIAIQTFFLIIPYNMCLGVFRVLMNRQLQLTNTERKFMTLFFYYLVIRMIILVAPLIALCFVDQDILSLTNLIQLCFQLGDSLISSLILLFSIIFFRKRFNSIRIQSQVQRKQLICQYTSMVIINVFRFILDLIFLIVSLYTNEQRCFEYNFIFTYVYVFLATLITHFLPILVIIKVYYPQQNQDTQQSLE